jgi:hypothetical protein
MQMNNVKACMFLVDRKKLWTKVGRVTETEVVLTGRSYKCDLRGRDGHRNQSTCPPQWWFWSHPQVWVLVGHLEWLHPSCLVPRLSMMCSWEEEPPAPTSFQPITTMVYTLSLDQSSNDTWLSYTHIHLEAAHDSSQLTIGVCCNTHQCLNSRLLHKYGHLLWTVESANCHIQIYYKRDCRENSTMTLGR